MSDNNQRNIHDDSNDNVQAFEDANQSSPYAMDNFNIADLAAMIQNEAVSAEYPNASAALNLISDIDDDDIEAFRKQLSSIDENIATGNIEPFDQWDYNEISFFAQTMLESMGYDGKNYDILRLIGYDPLESYADMKDEENIASSKGTRMSVNKINALERLHYAKTMASNAPHGMIAITCTDDYGDNSLIIPSNLFDKNNITLIASELETRIKQGQSRIKRDDDETLNRNDAKCMFSRLLDIIDDACTTNSAFLYAYPTAQDIESVLAPFHNKNTDDENEENMLIIGVFVTHNGRLIPITGDHLMMLVKREVALNISVGESEEQLKQIEASAWREKQFISAGQGNIAYSSADTLIICLLDAINLILSLISSDMNIGIAQISMRVFYEKEPEQIGALNADSDDLAVLSSNIGTMYSQMHAANIPFDNAMETVENITLLRAICARIENDDEKFAYALNDAADTTNEALLFDEWSHEAMETAKTNLMPFVYSWESDKTWASEMAIYSDKIEELPRDMSNTIERLLDACSALSANPINIYALIPEILSLDDPTTSKEQKEAVEESVRKILESIPDDSDVDIMPMRYTNVMISLPPADRPLLNSDTRKILRGLLVQTLQNTGGMFLLQAVLGENENAIGAISNINGEPISDPRKTIADMNRAGMQIAIQDNDKTHYFII